MKLIKESILKGPNIEELKDKTVGLVVVNYRNSAWPLYGVITDAFIESDEINFKVLYTHDGRNFEPLEKQYYDSLDKRTLENDWSDVAIANEDLKQEIEIWKNKIKNAQELLNNKFAK